MKGNITACSLFSQACVLSRINSKVMLSFVLQAFQDLFINQIILPVILR
jgi:hypothetical protein